MGIGITLGGGGGAGGTSVVTKVPDAATRLLLSPLDGDIVIQLDTDELYEWDATLAVWLKIGGAGTLSTYAGYSQINGEMISVPGVGFTETATQSYGMIIAKAILPGTTDMQGVNVNTPVDGTTAATNYSAFGVNSQMGTTTATVINQIEPFRMSGQYFSNVTSNGATTFGDNSQIIGAAITDFVSFNTNPVINTVTMNQVNSLRSNMSIGATSATHLNGFSGIGSFDQFGAFADLDGYTGLNFTPSFLAGSIVDGYTGYNHNPQIDSIGVGGYRGIILSANIGQGAAATINNHIDLQINPTYKTGSSLVSYNGIVVGANFELGATVTGGVQNMYANTVIDGQSIGFFGNITTNNSFGSTVATSITNYQEANFNANFNANTTIGDYSGLIIRPNVSPGSSITNSVNMISLGINATMPVGGSAVGINVDMSNFQTTTANQKYTFQGNGGALQSNSPFDTSVLTPSIGFGNNSLGGSFTIAAGFPVAGVFGFGNNLGITIDAQDDMSGDLFLGASSIGFSVNGFVNQVQVAATKTIDTLNYMFAGGSFPAGSTGGTITNLAMFRAIGLVNGGGTLNIINEIQFHGDAAVDGGAPTNLWGLRIDSTNAENYMAKSLAIGTATMKVAALTTGIEIFGKDLRIDNGRSLPTYQTTDAVAAYGTYSQSLSQYNTTGVYSLSAGVYGESKTGVAATINASVPAVGGLFQTWRQNGAADDGQLGLLVGMFGGAFQTSTGAAALTDLMSGMAVQNQATSGNVTDMYDYYASPGVLTGATVTNRYGIYIPADDVGVKVNYLADRLVIGSTYALPSTTFLLNGDQAYTDTDDATAGVITALDTDKKASIRLTAATDLQGITNAFSGKIVLIKNRTGTDVVIANQNAGAAAAERIITGTGNDFKLKDGQGISVQYDSTTSRWHVISGAASSGVELQGTRAAGVSISAATQIVPVAGAENVVFIVGNAGPVISTASPPVDTTSMVIGQKLKIIGTDDDNTVTYDSSVNFVLNGSYTLAKDYVLELMFLGSDGVDDAWVEVGRSH